MNPKSRRRSSLILFSSSTPSMPSLFSRSRTTSTPGKQPQNSSSNGDGYDEFGRISSRGSQVVAASLPAARNSNKKKDKDARARTVSSARGKGSLSVEDEQPIPDGSFLALSLEPPTRLDAQDGVAAPVRERDHDYGYLSFQRHVILGLEEADKLVKAVADELGTRGLTTPFIFSNLALDVSATSVRRLITAFLKTCHNSPGRSAETDWRDEVRFAGPHELGMCLRWGLARVVRLVGGNAVRGLVAWDFYVEWSEAEIRTSSLLFSSTQLCVV